MRIRAAWSVYIARCADGTLYTGVAKDVAARLAAHNAGRGAAYTRPRRPVRLVHREDGFTHGRALSREASIKSLPRPAKLALVKSARALAAAALLLLAAARARAVPAFTPENYLESYYTIPLSAAPVPPATSYPMRMYYVNELSPSTIIQSAQTTDGVTWIPEAVGGDVSSATLPIVATIAGFTGASVATLTSGGVRMEYALQSTAGAFSIQSATSVDGLNWTNDTGTRIIISTGGAYLGSPSVSVLQGGSWRMYFIENTDGASDLAARQIYTSVSYDQGITWSTPAVAVATHAFQVGASQLTDGRVRLYYTAPVSGASTATVVYSAISQNNTGLFFTLENSVIVSTPSASSIIFPVPVRSTDTFRWRLYYATPSFPGSFYYYNVVSALTGSPAPTGVSPASIYNTFAAASVNVNGEIFSNLPVAFSLQAGGQPTMTATGVTRTSDELISGTIDTVGQSPGLRDLVVTNADGTSTTLANALTITFPPGVASVVDNLISPRSGVSTAKINVTVYNPGNTTVKVFTIDGRHVTTLYDGPQQPGVLNLTWNGTFANGTPAPSGLYVLHVTGQALDTLLKIVVIR